MSELNPRSLIIRLGETLSEENNQAHQLWTWLPSYKVAQKHHGDYADSYQPELKDVLVEAAMYIASLRRGVACPSKEEAAEEREWFEQCPCGDAHAGPDAR